MTSGKHKRKLGSCRGLMPHSGDARTLADARHNRSNFLATLDKAHFLGVECPAGNTPIQIGTPGDCLARMRGILGTAK